MWKCFSLALYHCMPKPLFSICCLLCRDLVCPFTNRINIDPRKSPKLSRATQEISRSPRLPIRKPSIGSPSLTRREFPLDDLNQVKVAENGCVAVAVGCAGASVGLVSCRLIYSFRAVFYRVLSIFQQNYLAQVTSNIWGTKFKIVGLATFLPTNLGAGNLSRPNSQL